MRVWRISNYPDLRGLGGIKSAARWHSAGRPIVYACDHPAAALLEKLVHFGFESTDDLPASYQLLEIEIPKRVRVAQLALGALPQDWRDRDDITRAIGDAWLRSGSTVVLAVPSAITPQALNYLINPRHGQARLLRVVSVAKHPFDVRLFKLLSRPKT